MKSLSSIIVLCLGCKHVVDIKDGQGVSGNSHGYCEPCKDIELATIRARANREESESLLNSIFSAKE